MPSIPNCECKASYRMLPDEGEMGYRRVMYPGCAACKPESSPLAMIVDRYLQPLQTRHAILVRRDKISAMCWVTATPEERRITVDWSNNREDAQNRGTSFIYVNRPMVKIAGRWLRRCPQVVVWD